MSIIRASDALRITGLSKNVEDRKVEPFIPGVDLDLREILGATGYGILRAACIADYTLAGDAALRELRNDYVWPWMAWRTVELAGTRLWAEPQRGGTFQRDTDTFSTISGAALGTTKVDARDMASRYQRELVRFLTDNVSTYTWYEVDQCNDVRHNNVGGVIVERAIRPPNNWYEDGY